MSRCTKRSLSARTFVALAALVCGSQALAESTGRPSAPNNLCIQDSSGPSSCATTVQGTVKWHPGHYVRPSEQAFAYQDAARFAAYDRIRSNANFKGGLLTVPWGVVEPKQGVYDFTQIDKDLAYLRSMGKQLIIEIWWMDYWHSFTSARGAGWIPDYMIDNGCAVAATWDSGATAGVGYTIQLHKQECMDPLIALFQALAARYNSNPNLEQVIITEPSTPYASWDPTGYLTQFKRLVAAVGTSWPNTSSVFYMNWFRQPGEMMSALAAAGVGVGGPDVLPPPKQEDDGSQALRGAGGNFGTTDYRGRIPVSYSYETCCSVTPSALYDYAVNTLRTTHMAWTPTDSQSADMNWSTGVVPLVNARKGQVGSTACPSFYNGKCSSQ